mgnify:FL=1
MLRRLQTTPNNSLITLDELTGREIVAYLTATGNYISLLHKIPGQRPKDTGLNFYVPETYAFYHIGRSDVTPTFPSATWKGAIESAARCREIYIFMNYDELIAAIKSGELTPGKK